MPSTYTLISSNVLTSSAASVTFSAIPADYTDLVIRTSVRNDGGGTQGTMVISAINGSTGFSNRWIRGDGSGVISLPNLVGSYSYAGQTPSAGATTNTFDNTEFYFPNYLKSTYKPYSVFSTQENNSGTAYMGATAGLWSNTGAITSITLASDGTNFVSGSSFYLYGIKNS